MALVVRLGATTANATVLPGTVGVFPTMALELKANTFVHVLRREEVSELCGLRNLVERPDSILAFFLSCSLASFTVAFALSFGCKWRCECQPVGCLEELVALVPCCFALGRQWECVTDSVGLRFASL